MRDNLVISEWWIADSIKNKKDEIKKENKRLNKDGRGKIDSHFHGNDIRSNEIAASLRNDRKRVAMTEGLKLTIFTYKWGKCGKPVGKYPLESLIQ